MDKQINSDPIVLDADIKHVKDLASEITKTKRPVLPSSKFERRIAGISVNIQQHGLIISLMQIVLAIVFYFSQSFAGFITFGFLTILGMLSGLSLCLLAIVGLVPFLFQIRKEPYGPFLQLVTLESEFDLQFVYRLSSCNVNSLEYVLQYKLERNGLEKRGSMLSGAIDKIGIFPALAATALLFTNISDIKFGNGWLKTIPPSILAFHLINLSIFPMLQKMDRVIALLEHTVKVKNKELL